MATSVGQIGLDLVVNQSQFNKQMSGIQSMAKKVGATLAAAFAVKKIVEFGKSCLDLGSDLSEVQNVVDVTFPRMTAKVDEFAKSAATSFGLSETMAKQYTGTFGAMAKAFGFSESAAYDMGTTLTGLAGDVASFYNINQDEAYTKLKSVFTGETESLKDLGVVMTQTALDAYAMANGYGKTTSAMSEAEKVALRYAFVQNQLSLAQGDFARTSDGWANQIRILKLQFDSIKATLGQGFINLFTPIVKAINVLLGKIAVVAEAFKGFTELITGKKSSGGGGIASPVADLAGVSADAGTGLSNASGEADNLSDSTKGIGKAAKKAAKDMKALMGFDQINKISEPEEADNSDTDTGGGSSGTGGSAGGIGGGAVDFGALAEGDTVIDETASKFKTFFDDIKKGVQPTVDSLKRLWNEGLSQLGNFAWTALKDFYNGFLVPVGAWVFGEGIPRFIDALNNGLMAVDWGKINDSLKNLWDALTPFAINVGEGLLWFWENVLVPLGTWVASEVVPRFLDTLTIALDALNGIIEALKPLFKWFWDNVLKPIAEWTGGLFLSIWDKINEALSKFADWCNGLAPKVQAFTDKLSEFHVWASNNKTTLEILAVIFGGLATAIIANIIASNALTISAGLTSIAIGVYNGVTAIATTVTGAFSAALAFLTSPITLVIAAITAAIAIGILLYKNWDTIKAKALEIWGSIKDWFSKTIESIKGFFAGLWKGIKETYNSVGTWFKEKFQAAKDGITNIFKNIGDWFKERWQNIKDVFASVGTWFSDKFSAAWDGIKNAFSSAKTFFSDVWNGITDVFGNITGWFKDKFSAAWQAVKDVFSSGGAVFAGITDGILSGLKSVINSLISGINNVISIPFDGINWALEGIKGVSIAGFKPFSWLPSISTPQIPYLAQGGFVKANTPQLAMIGDNRHQGEVVAPEGKLRELAMEAVRMAGGSSGISKDELESVINSAVVRIVSALYSLGFNIDGQTLARAEKLAQNGLDRRFNTVNI